MESRALTSSTASTPRSYHGAIVLARGGDVDRIVVSGIEFFARGGVTEAEKQIGQHYRARIELRLDLSTAGNTDDLRDTVSYADAYEIVVSTAQERPFDLVEAAAERIAAKLLGIDRVESVRVELYKLAPPIAGMVDAAGVDIERAR